MGKVNVNRQNFLCVQLLHLRRHLNACHECRAAMKGGDYHSLCEWTQVTVVQVAIRWDRNIAGRLEARKKDGSWIFPCPDPNAHGGAYALTAEACVVESIQDTLI